MDSGIGLFHSTPTPLHAYIRPQKNASGKDTKKVINCDLQHHQNINYHVICLVTYKIGLYTYESIIVRSVPVKFPIDFLLHFVTLFFLAI